MSVRDEKVRGFEVEEEWRLATELTRAVRLQYNAHWYGCNRLLYGRGVVCVCYAGLVLCLALCGSRSGRRGAARCEGALLPGRRWKQKAVEDR